MMKPPNARSALRSSPTARDDVIAALAPESEPEPDTAGRPA